jgi:hypothetical protein
MNKALQHIADVGAYHKIETIRNYLSDYSSFDIEKVKATLKPLHPTLNDEEFEQQCRHEMTELLRAEFRAELKRDNYYWACVCMKHAMKCRTPQFHLDAYTALNDRTKRYKCLVRYRSSAKTAQKTNDILYNATEGLEAVMILVSSAAGLATNDLIEIKSEIESNDVIKEIYGDLKGQNHWNNRFIELANGVAIFSKGTTSQIRGTKWKGQRPTKIYLDDFEDEKNANSEEKREKLKTWFASQISPVGDVDFQIVLFGTIVHPDAFLANANPATNPNSIFGKANGFYSRVDIADENGKAVWPEKNDEKWIKAEYEFHKANNSLAFYYQEYFNIPAQESNPIIDTRMIKSLNARYCEQYGVSYLEVFAEDDTFQLNVIHKVPINVFTGIDPTRATNAMSDDFVAAAIGVTPSMNIVILDIEARIISIKDQPQAIVDFIRKYNSTHSTIETYQFQLGVLQYAEQVSLDNGYNLVLFPFDENKSKKAKYKESLIHPISAGRVSRLVGCKNYDKFEKQANKFSGGETEKDDTLDGVTLALHENREIGKALWPPYFTDVDDQLIKAKAMIDRLKRSKPVKNFMEM